MSSWHNFELLLMPLQPTLQWRHNVLALSVSGFILGL